MTTRLLPGVMLAGLCAGLLAGCPDNPYKASTWTKKLGNPREEEQAVTNLEHLGDPSAIPALGEAWQDQGKPVRLLQVIISLARPLTPQEANKENMTDYVKTGRPASWDKALPFLTKAIDDVDEANPRSTESAQKAADALGEAQDGLDSLIGIASKPTSKKLVEAQISAIRAMGKFQGDKAKAVAALIKLVDREPPPNPNTAPDRNAARGMEEKYALFLGITGASINAIGDLRAPSATKTLVLAMYRTPALFTQIRRALVASGPTAEDDLRKILRGENADVNQLFKDKHLDHYCGDQGTLPPDQCVPTSLMDYYPAVVLGDFYDPASVADLLAALKHPNAGQPAAFQNDAPALGTAYNAIFDSLKKIGAPEGADVVLAMWDTHEAAPAAAPRGRRGRKGAPQAAAPQPAADLNTRLLAIGAYPFLTRNDAGVEDLGKIAADNNADPTLRQEAATAYARLARDPSSIKVFTDLANKYFEASAKKRKEADGKPKTDKEAADKVYDAAKKVVIDAKAVLARVAADKTKTADDIHKATDDVKKAEDALKDARKKHDTATLPYRQADGAAKDYKNYARLFQTHIARIEVAIRCKNDLSCYAATLKETPEDAAKNCARWITDIKDWTKDEKLGLLEGEVERGMLEIGKQGQKASNLTDTLLDAAKSDDRLIRQSILLALPKIAKVPCDDCTQKLDAALAAGEGKSTLADLNLDTTMLRNYFDWAGGRTPSGSAAGATPGAPPPGKK